MGLSEKHHPEKRKEKKEKRKENHHPKPLGALGSKIAMGLSGALWGSLGLSGALGLNIAISSNGFK